MKADVYLLDFNKLVNILTRLHIFFKKVVDLIVDKLTLQIVPKDSKKLSHLKIKEVVKKTAYNKYESK